MRPQFCPHLLHGRIPFQLLPEVYDVRSYGGVDNFQTQLVPVFPALFIQNNGPGPGTRMFPMRESNKGLHVSCGQSMTEEQQRILHQVLLDNPGEYVGNSRSQIPKIEARCSIAFGNPPLPIEPSVQLHQNETFLELSNVTGPLDNAKLVVRRTMVEQPA